MSVCGCGCLCVCVRSARFVFPDCFIFRPHQGVAKLLKKKISWHPIHRVVLLMVTPSSQHVGKILRDVASQLLQKSADACHREALRLGKTPRSDAHPRQPGERPCGAGHVLLKQDIKTQEPQQGQGPHKTEVFAMFRGLTSHYRFSSCDVS